MSESEQEIDTTRLRQLRSRKSSSKKPLLSDFEQSYAANVAPKYLTHANRRHVSNARVSRIPGPVPPTVTESRTQSRRNSPEKRPRTNGSSKPPPAALIEPPSKAGKAQAAQRVPGRDKSFVRPTSSALGKSSFRRPLSSTGSKVSNIARHFERISKDSERANKRYAVIRGRRARPVASARPKVQVFDSIQDVMRNESESSDSSSDADDEDEDERQIASCDLQVAPEPTPEPKPPHPIEESQLEQWSEPDQGMVSPGHQLCTTPSGSLEESPIPSVPPSPCLPTLPVNSPSLTPPDDWGPTVQERHSFMKAISGLWSQQMQPPPPSKSLSDSYEDASVDPVHIHRDSPIALRTDEPTSIIAVALRWRFCTMNCFRSLMQTTVARTIGSDKRLSGCQDGKQNCLAKVPRFLCQTTTP